MEATTTKRRHTARPMSYYREMVKGMDDSQKLELVTMLIESVKPIQTRAVFDMPLEEDFPDMDKDLYTAEEAYELTMKDIKAIYNEKDRCRAVVPPSADGKDTTWQTPTSGTTLTPSRATSSPLSMPATRKICTSSTY